MSLTFLYTVMLPHGQGILPHRSWQCGETGTDPSHKIFCSVETADGNKVGRDWKVVKSEWVAWQETIARKQHDLHDDHKYNQPAGVFTDRNMKRSHQNWVKTYMEDITDSIGTILFNNLSWFTKKLCSVMTSVSVCENICSITGWIHNKRRNRLVQLSVEKAVRAHDNLVLRKVMMERHKMWLFGTVRLQSLNRTGTRLVVKDWRQDWRELFFLFFYDGSPFFWEKKFPRNQTHSKGAEAQYVSTVHHWWDTQSKQTR